MGVELECEDAEFRGYIEDQEEFMATVTNVKLVKRTYDGEETKRLEWEFKLEDPDGPHDEQKIWGQTGVKYVDHPDCKIKTWYENTVGKLTGVGYRINTDDLIGCRVVAIIKLREYEQDGQMKKRNDVSGLKPTRENKTKLDQQRQDRDDEPF